jgi:hypothetical protein
MKELSKIFAQAGTPVVDVAIDEKIKRVAGVSTRNITLTFADSQTITLSVKQSGDIYEVKVNNKVLPIKHQDNHKKAVIEMINALDAGRTKFQAALARTVVTLPKSVKTAAPKMVDALKAELAEKQAAIEAADVRLAEIQSEIDLKKKVTKSSNSSLKIREGHIKLKTPLVAEKIPNFGDYNVIINGQKKGAFLPKQLTIKNGLVVAVEPEFAKSYGLETDGDIQPLSDKSQAKADKLAAEKIQGNKNAKEAVWLLRIGDRIQKLPKQQQIEVERITNGSDSVAEKREKIENLLKANKL